MKRWLALVGLVAALVGFQFSDYVLHLYNIPGHSGIVIGDCYHFNTGYEFFGDVHFFLNEC